MRTALIGGVLIDGAGGPPRRDTTLLIEGSRIADVTQQRAFGEDVRILDLGGRTVMPGLIDCHIHFAHWGMNLIAYQASALPERFQLPRSAIPRRLLPGDFVVQVTGRQGNVLEVMPLTTK